MRRVQTEMMWHMRTRDAVYRELDAEDRSAKKEEEGQTRQLYGCGDGGGVTEEDAEN